MIPGLAGPLEKGGLKEGSLISVWATGCEAPLGVGFLALDGDSIGRGKKGKAVEMIHCWKDSCVCFCYESEFSMHFSSDAWVCFR